ncbi:anthranilate synthase component I family protein [Paenibacillus nuruki]|uniref:anthranilate synthase component I family protein n=1 Tax=Paenibacillus nuruki TaxID=1886670 RepID=UPI002805631F|nr:anthranilate synthase component I family protein [Paenibacillus nuruki]CAJ1317226.1 Aminodeoxychorismate synthase [Paenibacillus nuruki]
MTKVYTSFQQWTDWQAEGYTQLPYIVRIPLEDQLLPDSWEQLWQEEMPYSFVLENGKSGRYSYVGLSPVSILSGQDQQAHIRKSTDTTPVLAIPNAQPEYITDASYTGKPLDILRTWMSTDRAPKLPEVPPFTGGCVGFLSYDVARSLEKLPDHLSNDLGMPDYLWMKFNQIWVIDHTDKQLYCCVHTSIGNSTDHQSSYNHAATCATQMAEQWQNILQQAQASSTIARKQFLTEHPIALTDSRTDGYGFETEFDQIQFEKAVQTIQEYIRQGDVFQVNLSLRSHRPLASTPESVYEWLRLTNPSPYMGLLRTPDFYLVSASPELLVRVVDGKVSARPIAGTRRRGTTEIEDQAMEDDLLSNEKERAEHIMLVDLQRNDLGRIAKYGTVRVPELMTIERYSHVMHLVSGVEGELAESKDVYDVIAAVFPGGTITGAPKVRTMEIIEELEQTRRGAYTGSMGWIDYNGNMELNIIIRTLTVKDHIAYMQAGAGVVIDSEPYREYRECFNKSRAMARAVMLSEQYDQVQAEKGRI